MSEKVTISIVDDDASFREAMASLMKSHGYAASVFESGADFLACDRRTDCLIADMHMPGMTGLELHRRLSQSDRPIPTILITARHDPAVREQALRSGVLCYLTKPCDEDDLLQCVRTALAPPRGAKP